jgi:hypothetical protein
LFTLVDAANAARPEPFRSHVLGLMDVEEFMRVLATERIVGNWDSYGYSRGKNMFAYKPQQGRWALLPWDIDFVMSSGGNGPNDGLFGGNAPVLNTLRAFPEFQRAYWRAFEAAVNGPLVASTLAAQLDPRYTALLANGVNASSPQTLKDYAIQRRNYILTQLATVASPFSVNPAVTVNNGVGVITGTAPVGVGTIAVNGEPWTVRWTSVNNWTATVPLQTGSNFFSVVGLNVDGQPIAGASNSVATIYNVAVPSPAGTVVLNEIMSHPALPDAEYVELFNSSTTNAFDLSGWQFNGLGYTFPGGSFIAPQSYLVVAKDRTAFNTAYGPTISVFDSYPGNLQSDGETLSLLAPGPLTNQTTVVDRVRYESTAPWPAPAPGVSLQLVDATRDNARVANWASGQSATNATWVYYSTTGTATSSRLYLYLQSAGDLYLDDLKLVAGSVPDQGDDLVSNGGFENDLLGTWTPTANFAASALSTAVKHSGSSSLHLIATAPGSGSGNAIYQDLPTTLVNGQPYALSFWYRPSTNGGPLTLRLSGGGVTATVDPTPIPPYSPGAANPVLAALPAFPALWLNEAQANNVSGPLDNAGEHEPWIELFNPATNALSLDGYYLSDTYTNLTKWAFPANTIMAAGSFSVVWCDNQPGQSTPTAPHTNFRLAAGAGHVALSRLINNQVQLVDYLNYTNLPANWSYGDLPDAQPFYRGAMFHFTAGTTNNAASPPLTVFLNEWLADNTHTLADPADGNYEDWFELYNPGPNPADLGGYYLTDNLTNQFQFLVPNNGQYVIAPGGYLLVWADNETGQNSTNQADLHVNFALSKGGEAIGVFAADGTTIDAVTFGAQISDVTEGRYPDGTANIFPMTQPTPHAANFLPNTAPVLAVIPPQELTLGQTLTLTASATDADVPAQTLTYTLGAGAPPGALIHSSSGELTWTPTTAPATNSLTIIVTDNGFPTLSDTRTFPVTVQLPPTISVQWNTDQMQLTWPRGTLQAADEAAGPYFDVSTTSPYLVPFSEAKKFFRIRL